MAEIPNDISEKDLNTTEPLRRAIGDRYLKYALSTIMNRALPDARDGLKPVHRRILFAMRELKLASDTGYRKSAKISGDVMGNYHPHGDQAIYDALARLAQDFNVRYPLVDGQGNFGNIDGDNPAAARYTEARMTKAAELLLEGISQNAVEFNDNYDGTLKEPIVLPATFPNLLANGSSGIAVGMATNVPPHNLIELFNACIHLLDNPNAHDETLFRYIKGPDFPTGGVIVEPEESRLESYKTGRGSIRLRARWELESFGRGQWQIVVTEIPYQVQKSKLIEKIAELIQTKKVPALDDIRDESAEDIRIVLEPRSKNISPEALMETIFRVSDLEIRFKIKSPRIAITGLNPHAGEGGEFGKEEKNIISPVISTMIKKGFNLEGPLPADTAFTPDKIKETDCFLTMFHDQGLAPFKALSFGKGVNITLGLPFIRTSVDHGTAFDIVGTKKINTSSFYEAIDKAIQLSQ